MPPYYRIELEGYEPFAAPVPKYGELGNGYIEAHHLDPLSERPELQWTDELQTSVEDVTVLCANCHRMIHCRRPAPSLAKLKIRLKEALP